MLRTLKVRDLAIIDELELVLEPGLNVITGETGAGKSILLQALDAALGGRPDADLVRTGAEEAAVEALFTGAAPPAYAVLAAAGIAADDEIVIRRVIAAGGRTRAYVNDALGSLGLLRDLAPHLLRAYGQEEHHALRRVESHRELLDGIGGLVGAVEEMRRRHARLQAATQAVAERREAERTAAERVELLRFQASELAGARLVPGEQETLGAERSRLAHAERLAALVAAAEAGVYSGDASAVGHLGRALGGFAEAERLDASLEPTRRLLESALAELDRAGVDRDHVTVMPVPGAFELPEAAAESARRAAAEWAGRLSVERRRVARELERDLGRELATLALDDARFAVRFGEGRALGPEGWDEIEFFLSANPGEEPRSLARIASGGELSRIMLALKTLAAAEERGATLIFDEVDAGIGGAVAEAVGRKLAQLGRSRQVLCITHLPLIAAFAEHHIAVTKRVHAGRTTSTARPLTATERVAELARMLGGARLTRETREHAEHLLQQARPRKARREAAQT
ncbi:MAG: DNA repair protein RecN [Deltaproteobacteria bacterium]|nr:MAG: DNA repair protein RecN [Deltaproteobacteria bacterium]